MLLTLVFEVCVRHLDLRNRTSYPSERRGGWGKGGGEGGGWVGEETGS